MRRLSSFLAVLGVIAVPVVLGGVPASEFVRAESAFALDVDPLLEPRSSGPSLIVLVRHAERDGPSADDPGLTEVGEERARELARLLADAGITRIHATDTRRTRETAQPLADSRGLAIESFDGRDLEAIARRLLEARGRHLVVGHSNTTDELSELLGGDSYGPIVEEWEYDRLYFLVPGTDGGMATVMIRFGPRVVEP